MSKRFMVRGTWKSTGKVGNFGLANTHAEAEEILRQAALAGNTDLLIVDAADEQSREIFSGV